MSKDKSRKEAVSRPAALRIIPLGGVEEVGKNCTVFEFQGDSIVVDLGLDFPDPDFPGARYLLPDISYLKNNKQKIRALILTHGHLDHIGAISYLIRDLGNPPIFGSKLTLALVEDRLREKNLDKEVSLKEVDSNSVLYFGKFKINFFRVNHNIPDSLGLAISTPFGTIIHTGDFKFDENPVDQLPAEKDKLKGYARNGVFLLFSDSTNADVPGKAISEKTVGQMIDSIFSKIKGRIIFTSFSTLISRTYQVIESCQKYQRKIVVFGLSSKKIIKIASELGYLKTPPGLFIKPEEIKNFSDKELLFMVSGSQGTEGSAMSRIAKKEFHGLKIKPGDTVVFSSSAIPGNEIAIYGMMNNLIDQGAEIIYEPILGLGIHSSGHAPAEDLKEIINITKPQFFVPIHGGHYLQAYHIKLAEEVGLRRENIFMLYNGSILEIDKDRRARVLPQRVVKTALIVEGETVRPFSGEIFKERKKLAEDGICVVRFEEKVKNFVRIKFYGLQIEKNTIKEIEKRVIKLIIKYKSRRDREEMVEMSLGDFVFSKIGKRPRIVVI